MSRDFPLRSRGSLARRAKRGAIDFAFARRLSGLGSALSYCAKWGGREAENRCKIG